MFPEGSLANSIIVTVWVGILVVAFFNLRFGWVLSGLVVPGYIVPLLLVNPVSALVIIFEAWVTYAISLAICNKTGTWLKLSHFFGRDRFFLLVIISVAVRLTFDAFLFPTMSSYLEHTWDTQLRFQNDLHSFGLIIISLMANQMWKTGFLRGSWHLFVTLAITFLIVKYVIIAGTNFSIANLSFMYEEIAVAILASPKSYIIVLLCCFIASRMNLRYGWEFSGILIPSLLALQWYFPQKILVTFVETFVILGLGTLVLKIPRVANMNIAGARKLVVFFTLGFIYKLTMAYIIEWYNPYLKVSDYFAFGYLLSTLLAIKIHDKKLLIHTTRATLQISLIAVICATFIGFGLTKINLHKFSSTDINIATKPIEKKGESIDEWLLSQKVNFFENKSQGYIRQPSVTEIDNFTLAIKQIDLELQQGSTISQQTQQLFARVGYVILDLGSHYVLQPVEDKTRGVFALNKDPQAYSLLISTPRGLDENLAYDASFSLYKLLNAKYLAISTSPFKNNEDGSSDSLLNPNSFFSFFQKILSNNNVLQVRTTKRDVELVAKRYSHLVKTETDSYLWIKGGLRKGFDLNALSEFTKEPELVWSSPDFFNQQRSASSNGFLELLINQAIANRLKVLASNQQLNVQQVQTELSIEGYLNDLILKEKNYIAPKLSELYIEPKNYEALFLHEQILNPLLELIDVFNKEGEWSEESLTELSNLNELARLFSYQLSEYTYVRNKRKYLILSELPGQSKRYWGTYIFTLGESQPQIVEIPRPIMEIGTFEYGLYLFSRLNARALLIASAHPNANSNGKSDFLSRFNTDNSFNIVHYSLFKHYRNEFLQAQVIRGMGFEQAVESPNIDVLISETNNIDSQEFANDSLSSIENLLNTLNLSHQNTASDDNANQFAIGQGTNSLENQLRYQANKQIITQWISPRLNDNLRQSEEQWLSNKHFTALDIERETQDVFTYLNSATYSEKAFSNELVSSIDSFVSSDNIVYFLDVLNKTEFRFKLITDIDSKHNYLFIFDAEKVVASRNLNGINPKNVSLENRKEEQITKFINDRANWLFAESLEIVP